jgi:alcohol dehydrogenase (NADP+)
VSEGGIEDRCLTILYRRHLGGADLIDLQAIDIDYFIDYHRYRTTPIYRPQERELSMELHKTSDVLSKSSVDPATVPHRVAYTGARIPTIGLGTFGSDHVSAGEIAAAVEDAAAVGYRHFDCASVYGNEPEIGFALQRVMQTGIKREELWITSKLWNDKHGEEDVIASCRQSLADLRLDYLDLYLVHWPFPNFHPPGCDVTSRSKEAKAYVHTDFIKTWRKMEELVSCGLVRHIGTSNMTIPKLKLLLRDARIKPAVNEMELHPHFQQPELFEFVRSNNIVPVGYCPIGSPARPERDRTPDDTVPTQDPVIVQIANRLRVHPAVVCVKWAVQRGQVPIPFSTKRDHYLSNLQGIVTEPLTHEEMKKISAIDRNCRLIKGQVFLWKEGQSWEDLWDVNGEITP